MIYEIRENNSISDYKNSIFETILVVDGHPYFLDEHLARLLKAGNDILGINLDIDNVKLFINCNIPLTGQYGARIICNENGCILSFRDVEYRGSGNLKISGSIRDSQDIKYRYKTNDYGDRLEELAKAKKEGYLDSIYLNEKGFITSCSVANIYFIKNGVVHTPSLENGVLDGIVRSIILRTNQSREGNYTIRDFIESDGIFISNSLMGIIQVNSIEDQFVACDEMAFYRIKEFYRLEMNFDRRKCCG